MDLVGRVDHRVLGRVSHVADCVAEIEDIVARQTGIGRRHDRDLQPLVDNHPVGPCDHDPLGTARVALEDHDILKLRGIRPSGQVLTIADAELEVVGIDSVGIGQSEHVDHNAVDAAAVVGVVPIGRRRARPKGLLVGRHGRIDIGSRPRRVIIEHASGNDLRLDHRCFDDHVPLDRLFE